MRNSAFLVDSFVWLEILQGRERGRRALELMDESEALHTSVVNLYEVSYRVRQIRDETSAKELITSISLHAQVHPVDHEIALAAALLRIIHGYGAIDALYHATAEILDLTMLTGDLHFKEIEGAILV
jgi:predicted nucleic acid-binding protein